MSNIIIHKPVNLSLPRQVLERAFKHGSDAIGFCYSENNKIVVRKNFTKFDNFYEEFVPIEKYSVIVNLIDKDWDCKFKFCGPFKLDNNHFLVHSGDIWAATSDLKIPEESQTANFVNELKKFWNPLFFKGDNLSWLLESLMPSQNRLIIMNNEGEVHIFNKNKGLVLHDCWFSESPYTGNYTTNFYPSAPNTKKVVPFKRLGPDIIEIKVCSICKHDLGTSKIVNIGYQTFCGECYDQIYPKGYSNSEHKQKTENDFLSSIIDPNEIDVFDLF